MIQLNDDDDDDDDDDAEWCWMKILKQMMLYDDDHDPSQWSIAPSNPPTSQLS